MTKRTEPFHTIPRYWSKGINVLSAVVIITSAQRPHSKPHPESNFPIPTPHPRHPPPPPPPPPPPTHTHTHTHTHLLTLFTWNLSIENYDVWGEITYQFTNFNGAAVTSVTLYYAYGYLSILGLKIRHDSKMGPGVIVEHRHKLAYREYLIHCIQCVVYG